ncbi:AAA domain-containing protein [Nocardia cyriacigeorgica]|uniref:AAA domain-containing protein n=1 Tax=Nocardia cyriacigeorgica TaxID=135487 RepID=UPI002B4B2F6D|nr:AAA domain-containing protein [Nocardia cyriacigeorgica]
MAESEPATFPVPDLLRAVRAEISAALNGDAASGDKVVLHDGRRRGTNEYVFSCKAWKQSLTGKDLLIKRTRSRAAWEKAEAAPMPDGSIRVVTEADLGATIPSATLTEDDTVGLEKLVERLEGTTEPNDSFHATTAGRVVGLGSPHIGRCADPERFLPGYRDRTLNLRQRRAVEQALASEATFIWGPPGTGKTEVVGCIVEGCYRQGLNILFVAPTNVAVDQALRRICDLLCKEEQFDTGIVQRKGEISVESLTRQYGDRIVPELIAERLSVELDEQITGLRVRMDAVGADIAAHEEAEALAETLSALRDRHIRLEQAVAQLEAAGQAAQDTVNWLESQVREIGAPSGLFANRKQTRIDELTARRHQVELDREGLRQQAATARTARDTAASDMRATATRLTESRRSLGTSPPLEYLRELAAGFRAQLDELQTQRQRIAETVRSNCRVMGTTVARAARSRKLMNTVDVVVIDEAGMVDLPSAWLTASLAGKRLVVAGDFRQLPAVTRGSGSRSAAEADRAHSRMWMDRDAFHAAGLVSESGTARLDDPRMVALDEQYRMRPAICSLVNTVAYPDAPLSTGRSDISGLPKSALIESPLVLVDTSRAAAVVRRRDAHKSNTVHEAVIHELIRGLQYDTVLPARKWTEVGDGERATDRLAVIVPYNDQKRSLTASLKYRFGEHYDGLVDTVHRFQGSQRPLVVIDTVAGAGKEAGYFYEGTRLDSDTCRLLNVALSRAQDHLVVVANVDFLRSKLVSESPAIRMLDQLEAEAQRLSVADLIPIRSAADLANLDEEQLARPAFFPADEVDRAIEWDIQAARKSIDIYCAFLNPVPVRRWAKQFSARIAESIRVTVYTRRHDDDPRAAQLVGELKSVGCEVIERERMHEKVMIVDDTVLWHGSLNLLASRGPTDLMMRITDPASCARVRHIVDRARMERPARKPYTRQSSTDSLEKAPAAGADIKPGDVVDGRRYLEVPYAEKDEAKEAVRAKFDWDLKLWHVDASIAIDSIAQWLPPTG